MNTPGKIRKFKGNEADREVFYLYENGVTKNLCHSEKSENILAYLSYAALTSISIASLFAKLPIKNPRTMV